MADLSIEYLGIKLKNPIIVAASGLVSTVDGVKKASEAGAGAIVLKSLFEEQLRAEMSEIELGDQTSSEAAAFIEQMGIHGGAGDYLRLIRDAKSVSGVPIIASVNCVEGDLWVDYAEQIESAGADALELNIGIMPRSPSETAKEIEDRIAAVVRNVSVRTSLPLAVKLGPYFTNPANLVERLAGAGAGAAVLFNRFYRLDVDLAASSLAAGPMRSGDDEYHESLRWIANMYGAVSCELVAGSGIHSAESVLKLISVGAAATQICSAIYRGGWNALSLIVQELPVRMDVLGIASISAFRGKLSRRSNSESGGYERLQYVKALTGIS
ncbi:MAG TPA: hypothetical protein DIC34_13170 [Treponema sp.]|nr:MAG: hypothetical protein A2Y36_02380 [Treponema sp. GWA1_62_8]OHE67382.1 MAG: hypothetical protein A2001_07175 [Treponema sp. GWC1_61_84]OHE76216.1 MAG: hypothetical protein A2413_01115 [Treponema sp. RIFOXYC1_FULL_61_9]HCM27474.1 hypothetical protein [Treponema sp.]